MSWSEEPSPSDRIEHSAHDAWTIQRVLTWSTSFLKDKCFETPRLDAELLLGHALAMTRIQLYTSFDKPLTADEREPFKLLLRRRALGEPIAYITGFKDFMGYSFRVSPVALIPRPDTEVLVEAVLKSSEATREGARILDVGTGTGCIAISLAKRLPAAQVTAWDIDEAALSLARANAADLAADSVAFLQADALCEGVWQKDDPFDVIVSNPPYIAESERASLSESVKAFEPGGALFAPEDGLRFYRAFSELAGHRLRENGKLFIEIGSTQADVVTTMLVRAGWRSVQVLKDYNKLNRVVIAEAP